MEVIKVIEQEKLIDNCVSTGQYFKDQLTILKDKYAEKIKEIRARGLMLAVEFPDTFDGEKLSRELFENGFVLGFKKNTLRFLPPLIITQKEIDKLIKRLDEILISQ